MFGEVSQGARVSACWTGRRADVREIRLDGRRAGEAWAVLGTTRDRTERALKRGTHETRPPSRNPAAGTRRRSSEVWEACARAGGQARGHACTHKPSRLEGRFVWAEDLLQVGESRGE